MLIEVEFIPLELTFAKGRFLMKSKVGSRTFELKNEPHLFLNVRKLITRLGTRFKSVIQIIFYVFLIYMFSFTYPTSLIDSHGYQNT
jgi:hypothetical protein